MKSVKNPSLLNWSILFYCIFNSLMLFNNGIFIDDWKYYDQTTADLINCFNPEGWYYTGIWAIHAFLFSFPYPMLVYHLCTFLLGLGILVLFYKILSQTKFDKLTSGLTALVFSVSPYYFMKNSASTLPYTLCLFLFLTSYHLILKTQKQTIMHVLFVSIFLLYSFITNSIILLYPILLLHLYFHNHLRVTDFLKRYFWLILIPVVFIALRYTLLKPISTGTSQHYNRIDPNSLIHLPGNVLGILKDHILYFLEQLINYKYLAVLLFGIYVYLTGFRFAHLFSGRVKIKGSVLVIILGSVLFVTGITPYLLVQKYPVFKGWETRHQLLIPFGVSLILSCIITLSAIRFYRIVFLSTILTTFSVSLLAQTSDYYKGWFKYELISGYFANHDPGPVKTLVFEDDQNCQNATDRVMSYFEINGLYKMATGKQDRYFVGKNQKKLNKEELQKWIDIRIQEKLMSAYNMRDYKQVDERAYFYMKCNRSIKNHELPRFVYLYYFGNTGDVYRRYSDHMSFEIRIEK
ncbi:MAG: hypothetical protein H6605_07665 [Flavobacteriales bacterium]|nr:hypothetical protein [Flavobacteriales bacterium]